MIDGKAGKSKSPGFLSENLPFFFPDPWSKKSQTFFCGTFLWDKNWGKSSTLIHLASQHSNFIFFFWYSQQVLGDIPIIQNLAINQSTILDSHKMASFSPFWARFSPSSGFDVMGMGVQWFYFHLFSHRYFVCWDSPQFWGRWNCYLQVIYSRKWWQWNIDIKRCVSKYWIYRNISSHLRLNFDLVAHES